MITYPGATQDHECLLSLSLSLPAARQEEAKAGSICNRPRDSRQGSICAACVRDPGTNTKATGAKPGPRQTLRLEASSLPSLSPDAAISVLSRFLSSQEFPVQMNDWQTRTFLCTIPGIKQLFIESKAMPFLQPEITHLDSKCFLDP